MPLKFEIKKVISSHIYWSCDCLSMSGLKLVNGDPCVRFKTPHLGINYRNQNKQIFIQCWEMIKNSHILWCFLLEILHDNDKFIATIWETKPSLDQILTCRLLGAQPLSKPMKNYYQPSEINLKFGSKCKIFIHEDKFKNVVSITLLYLAATRECTPGDTAKPRFLIWGTSFCSWR